MRLTDPYRVCVPAHDGAMHAGGLLARRTRCADPLPGSVPGAAAARGPAAASLLGMTPGDGHTADDDRYDEEVRAAQHRAGTSAAWSAQVMALTGAGSADRGRVRATVNLDGIVTGLSVADSTAARGGRVVELAVQSAVHAAQEHVLQQTTDLTTAQWGADSPTTRAVTGEISANVRTPDPDEPVTGPANPGGQW